MIDIPAHITNCLKGKEKLWKVFWLWFVAVMAVLGVVSEFAAPYAIASEAFMVDWLKWVFLVLLIYIVWILRSLWSCAFNAAWKGWGYLTRAMVVVLTGIVLLAVVYPFTVPV